MNKMTFDDHKTTILKDVQMICLEASVLSNTVSTIRNLFPSFVQKLSEDCAQIESIPEIKIKLPQLQKFVITHIDDKQYLDLADLSISVPEGFIGSICDYAEALCEIAKQSVSINETTIKPFTTYLAQFISNKDAKLSTTDTTGKYTVSSNVRKQNLDKIMHFTRNGTNTQAKLGDVISRKADIHQLFIKNVLLTETLAKIDLKFIHNSIKECVDLLNIIVDQIQAGNIASVTPEVTKNLTMSALRIAEEVEFMALIHFKSLGFVTCVDSLTATLSACITDTH